MYVTEKNEVNEQFGKMMIQYVSGNRKFFWKEITKVNGGKNGIL